MAAARRSVSAALQSSQVLIQYHPRIRARQQLVELLDRVVFEQHIFRSLEGRFTSDLTRLNVSLPLSVLTGYDIRVEEATRDRLRISARILPSQASEGVSDGTNQSPLSNQWEGEIQDSISVNEKFDVLASFPIPPPRATYLREHAMRHLQAVRAAPRGQIPAEQGIYRGFFRFEIAAEDHTGYGLGVRAPVLGVRFDLNQGWAKRDGRTGEKGSEGASEGADEGGAEPTLEPISAEWADQLSPLLLKMKWVQKSPEFPESALSDWVPSESAALQRIPAQLPPQLQPELPPQLPGHRVAEEALPPAAASSFSASSEGSSESSVESLGELQIEPLDPAGRHQEE
jgi:hypothetical protein